MINTLPEIRRGCTHDRTQNLENDNSMRACRIVSKYIVRVGTIFNVIIKKELGYEIH
jgi:hypothetical protein